MKQIYYAQLWKKLDDARDKVSDVMDRHNFKIRLSLSKEELEDLEILWEKYARKEWPIVEELKNMKNYIK